MVRRVVSLRTIIHNPLRLCVCKDTRKLIQPIRERNRGKLPWGKTPVYGVPISDARAMQIVTGNDKVLQECGASGLTRTSVFSRVNFQCPNYGRGKKEWLCKLK